MANSKARRTLNVSSERKVVATYSPTLHRWLLTFAPVASGKRGRPKDNNTYTTALLFLNLRRQGWKYDAAVAAVAELRNISTRTVKRHWDIHKGKVGNWLKKPLE